VGLDAFAVENTMNLPNLLTLIRIGTVPIVVGLLMTAVPMYVVVAAAVFGLATLTDLLDGYLARRWAQITRIGKLLDPIADKLLVLSALIMLVELERVAAWVVIILVGREVAVTGLRAMAASEGIVIAAEQAGKTKTLLQNIAIIFLMLDYRAPVDLHRSGIVLLWASIGFALFSGIQYGLRFRQHLKLREASR
jgi:CDP-diacylglycerol--glycerol-3-phosphate 3-phosphatidyltransferase